MGLELARDRTFNFLKLWRGMFGTTVAAIIIDKLRLGLALVDCPECGAFAQSS